MAVSFQDRLGEAIRRAGGQSELARMVTKFTGKPVSPQAIQYLADRKRKKPARGSRLVAAIAAVTGLRAEWLSDGKGPRESKDPVPQTKTGSLETTMEVDGVELTKQALQVARALMKLPENRRDDYQQEIETEALKYSSRIRDAQLEHLAAPSGKKKRVAGTQ